VKSEVTEAVLRQDERRERWWHFALSVPALSLVALLLYAPIAWLFFLSVIGVDGQFSLENFARLWESRAFASVVLTTFQVSLTVTGVCLLLGFPLAYVLSQLPIRIANLCMIAVILPYWVPILVRTYAWLVILQRRGLVNDMLLSAGIVEKPLPLVHNFTGTVIGMVHLMLPLLVLPLYGALRSIDRTYQLAASNLGANPTAVFWKVFFPLSRPGMLAGIFIVFVMCLGFYVTPAVLGGGRVIMVAQQIATTVEVYSNNGAASAIAVVLVALTGGFFFMIYRFGRVLTRTV
jgi:putative spermidine/putrescine transport system permease protein/spermidine/putrescine transport system permease protein